MIGAGLANEEVRYVDVLSGDSDLGVANEEILYSDSQETKEKLIQATMEELRCMEEADVEDGDAAELELLSSDNSVAKEEMVRAAVEAEMRNSFAVVTVDSDEELILTTTAVEELLKGNRGCSSVPIQGLKQRNKCNSIPYSVHAMRTRNSKSKGTVGCFDTGRRDADIWAAIDEQQQSMERLEAMLQQLLEWQPNPNAPTPANRDGVEGVAFGHPGGGRPPRAARRAI
ncbi:hypothetical protein LWI28_008057 [Acer negundo]|uniref:Uncharacterized protein n=1 Tax=Acer negundo TaxID=4023 RepID=A0AAD5IYB3_ACENE|nr:hypothetical protein LWI28_008057 [Acer negundo]